ncbi:beta-lactamase [Stackebrandtia nassauensis DSM 44728]|uniref:Beta-lactamase n=2 Tax=Stackebrandtia TaxID=283810 RepID=D3Q7M7_STANL|nr:beta-lactamase [Stackebrandtia nassauensis DSM 44728]
MALSAGAVALAGEPEGDGECGYAKVTSKLKSLVADHGVTGAAIDVRFPGCGKWTKAVGLADRETERPMRTDQRVRIGSITKTYTATVVMQLVADGEIDLDQTVEHYLPNLVQGNGYDGAKITVRELLRHESGLPDHTDALPWEDYDSFRYRTFQPEELVGMALDMPHPDQEWTYSSTNYVLAGMIVEKVTGEDIGDEITDRIIDELDLPDTYWPGSESRIRGPHPRGYWPEEDGGKRDVTRFNTTFGGASGSLISTMDDQQRFFAALLDGELLDEPQLEEMRETVPADEDRLWEDARYGLGLIETPVKECGGVMWGHGGTSPGYKVFNGTTTDGRQVQLALNDNVTTDAGDEALFDTIRAALCVGR